MITDLDETIRTVLKAELPIKNGEIDVKFDQPKREWSARLNKPTINFYLYDVRENNVLRTHQWERMPRKNGKMNIAEMKRTPLRVDCFYMMTVWASEPEDEHRLLTRSMMALFKHPVLPKPMLTGSLEQQPFELRTKIASHDKLTNPAEVWSALDNEIRPSVSYVVTLALDPWTEIEGPVVRNFTMRTGTATRLPDYQELDEGGRLADKHYIGGTVRSKGKDKEPMAGIEVAIKGTGLFASTNSEGQFILGPLLDGKHTIVAWPEKGKPVEKKVDAPGSDFDIEM